MSTYCMYLNFFTLLFIFVQLFYNQVLDEEFIEISLLYNSFFHILLAYIIVIFNFFYSCHKNIREIHIV